MEAIVSRLEAAADAYYNGKESQLSDDEFDALKDQLAKMDIKHPFLKKVGAPPQGASCPLPFYMGSLNKIRDNPDAIEKFKNKYSTATGSFRISDKLDGNSALLMIDAKGSMKMYSRGDGTHGQDVSHLAPMGPTGLKDVAIRGELIIKKVNWNKINDVGANARNVVAGAMMRKKGLDPRIKNEVEFVAYEIISGPKRPLKMQDIADAGMNIVHFEDIETKELNQNYLMDMLKQRRKDSDYEIDGIVIEHIPGPGLKYKRKDGSNPTYAFAFKSMETHVEAEVTVEKVQWTASKDGFLKPVVIFTEPVKLAGVMISQATGFNASFIEKNVIGPGAIITIIRSGDVIPHIVKVNKQASQPDFPNMDYEWNDTHVDIIAEVSEVKRMEHFTKTLDIKNVGAGVIQKLFDNGITTIPMLLSVTVDEIVEMDGFQKKSAEKVVESLAQAKTAPLINMMAASNLFGRGVGTRKLAPILEAIPDLVTKRKIPKAGDLAKIKGFGPATCESFLNGIADFYAFIDEIGYKPPSAASALGAASGSSASSAPSALKAPATGFAGKTIVFTGFRNKEWEAMIKAAGGNVTTTISKKTNLLVAKDPDENSSKITKAQEFGIEVISVEEFESRM
jgi:NAD-dependent DNA ligase